MYWSLYYRTIILTDQLRFPLIVRITTRSWAVLSAATVSVVIQQTWSNERYCFKHSSVPVFWAVLSEVLRASSCELCIYVCSIIYETHNGYLYESYCYINSIDEEWSGYTGAGFEWYILTHVLQIDREHTIYNGTWITFFQASENYVTSGWNMWQRRHQQEAIQLPLYRTGLSNCPVGLDGRKHVHMQRRFIWNWLLIIYNIQLVIAKYSLCNV